MLVAWEPTMVPVQISTPLRPQSLLLGDLAAKSAKRPLDLLTSCLAAKGPAKPAQEPTRDQILTK